jgi:hypothetical protein
VKRQPVLGTTFNILDAASRKRDTFINTVDELLAARNDKGSLHPGAIWLPDAQFVRDLGLGGIATAGGNLGRPALAQVAAAARPQLLLDRLGAQRVVVTNASSLSLPVWTAGAAAGWIAENATAPQNTSTVRHITLAGRVACSRLLISRKMFLGWADIQSAALAELGAGIAATIEAGFFAGTGSSNQPLGLLNTPGRSTVTFAASTPTYSELRQVVTAYIAADGDLESAAWVVHPSDFGTLLTTAQVPSVGSDNAIEFHSGQWRIFGMPIYPSRSTSQGSYLLFNPKETVTAYWGSPQLIADGLSNGKSITGATDLIVFNLCDVGALHPARLVVGSA